MPKSAATAVRPLRDQVAHGRAELPPSPVLPHSVGLLVCKAAFANSYKGDNCCDSISSPSSRRTEAVMVVTANASDVEPLAPRNRTSRMRKPYVPLVRSLLRSAQHIRGCPRSRYALEIPLPSAMRCPDAILGTRVRLSIVYRHTGKIQGPGYMASRTCFSPHCALSRLESQISSSYGRTVRMTTPSWSVRIV